MRIGEFGSIEDSTFCIGRVLFEDDSDETKPPASARGPDGRWINNDWGEDGGDGFKGGSTLSSLD